MSRYPDTSFLYALYRRQDNSAAAYALLGFPPAPLTVTEPLLYEFRQSVRFQVYLHEKDFRKGFPRVEADALLAKLEANLATGQLVVTPVNLAGIFARAETFSVRHTEANGHRAFDILHVATAKELGAGEFLSFDANQRRLAVAEGLTVLPVDL